MTLPNRPLDGDVERPLVTVVIPARNPRRDWFHDAVTSVFHEPGCRIELIVVDDGSDPPLTVTPLPPGGGSVRIIRSRSERPLGPGPARNLGLERATGEYVRFLDADDLFEPGSTSLLVRLASAGGMVSYGATRVCDRDLAPTGRIGSALDGLIHRHVANGRFHTTLPALVFPRAVIDQVGKFDERLIVQQDWDFVLRATEVSPVVGSPEFVYVYRRHRRSHSSGARARREAARSTTAIIRAYLKRHPELEGTAAERKVRAYAQFLIVGLRNPRNPMRTGRFWRAAAADPLRGLSIFGSRGAAILMERIRSLFGGRIT